MDFAYSQATKDLQARLLAFMQAHVYPAEEAFHEEVAANRRAGDPWKATKVIDDLKSRAQGQGLWNLFKTLSNLEYAPLCEIMGRSAIGPESFNCNAPDTGNMEVLARYGTPEQQKQWLEPLLAGKIRSAFAMTEPAVASSDATNIESRIVRDGGDYVINGRKWWTTGAPDPRCKILIFMGKSSPGDPNRHKQQSMILVPMDTPGVKLLRKLTVFGDDDAPHGHAEIEFTDVRVPAANMLLGEGRGFEIAQGRLGPGRIHHCMRAIGVAERALEMAIKRAKSRVAFGQRISEMGVTKAHVADMRMEIDMARLLVLKAAWAMDKFGNKEARQQIAMIKVAVPNITSKVVDRCLQLHGAGGVSQVFKLASMYAHQRTLRLADGPDEVHRDQVGRLEIAKHN